jgi:hypothetical protein
MQSEQWRRGAFPLSSVFAAPARNAMVAQPGGRPTIASGNAWATAQIVLGIPEKLRIAGFHRRCYNAMVAYSDMSQKAPRM